MKKGIFTLLAFILVMGTVLAGCGSNNNNGNTGNGEETSEGAEQVFRINLSSDPPSLDPGIAQDNTSFTVLRAIYEGLTRIDAEGNVVPAVAEKWDVSKDGLTYVFKLREDVKWSNGEPVKASDFEFAWKRALAPETASPYAYQLYYLKNGAEYNAGDIADADQVGVKATGDYELTVELNAPTPYFESLVSFFTYYPLNEKHVSENPNFAADAEKMVTNGAFNISEWSHGDKIVLTKNPDFFEADQVHLTKVQMSMVEDAITELSMYQTGELDWAGRPNGEIPTDQIPALKDDPEANLQIKGIASTYYYNFNNAEEPFDNVKIRKALSMAIDRQAIIDNVTKGDQLPAFGMVSPGIQGQNGEFREEYPDKYFEENVEEAKKLLAEGLAEKGLDKLPTVNILYNTPGDGHKKIAEAIADMWRKNLGIEVELDSQEWGVFLQTRTSLNYQVSRAGWGADYNDPMTFIDMFTSTSGNNDIGFNNAEYDALVQEAYSTDDPQVRMDAMAKAEKILIEDNMAILPIYYYTGIWLQQDYVKNVVIDYSGNIDFTRGSIEK
ncbi:peptide ABC transporter substrate-binding protein [Marinicrinis lubricantis]|uniref:Peptide ABC transporter substrate-binding protein n=1 Tax=Marinicrinis lubricantis TaxID=2086470 RepID=A0ABW1IUK8_9BACL